MSSAYTLHSLDKRRTNVQVRGMWAGTVIHDENGTYTAVTPTLHSTPGLLSLGAAARRLAESVPAGN